MIALSPDDERIARALWEGIRIGPWKVFPRYDPTNLPTAEEFADVRLDLCRFAVAAVREAITGGAAPGTEGEAG